MKHRFTAFDAGVRFRSNCCVPSPILSTQRRRGVAEMKGPSVVKRLTTFGRCATALALCAVACGGSAEAPSERDDAAAETVDGDLETVLADVRALGFDESTVELIDHRVIVEHDIELDREALRFLAARALAGAGAVPQQGVSDPGSVEKGYFKVPLAVENPGSERGSAYVVPRATSVSLNFDDNVQDIWVTAFTEAAATWNNECINVRVGQGSDGIRVMMDTTLPPNVAATGTFPVLVNGVTVPGGAIRINPSNAIDTAEAYHIATHELGHNLGFAHPGDGGHILRTGLSGVPTIMAPQVTNPPLGELTEDDVNSRDILYRIIEVLVPDPSGRGSRVIERCPNGTDVVPYP